MTQTTKPTTKTILIAGFGPAGASAAIFIAKQGFKVTVIERRATANLNTGLKPGESLPPDAKKLLEQLDCWHDFEKDNHLKCYANVSYWRSEKATYHDFIEHPIGHGWHIDRLVFETMLRDKALSLGITLIENNSIESLKFTGGQWKIQFNQPIASSHFNYIIDATGRSSVIARKLGFDKLYDSQQLALVAFLQASDHVEDGNTLVETVPQGWWYSASIPGNRLAFAFFFDPEKHQFKGFQQAQNWWALVKQAKNTHKRIINGIFELIEPPKMVNADSTILEKISGQNWLAVGDAAMTYDPIASHGLMMSMVSARDASLAIQEHCSGQNQALEQYAQRLYQSFMKYRQLRQEFF